MLNILKNFLWANTVVLSLLMTGCATVKVVGMQENKQLKPTKLLNPINISPYLTIPKHIDTQLTTKYLDQKTGFIYIGRISDNPPKPSKLGHDLAEALLKTLDKKPEGNILINTGIPKDGLWIKGQMTEEIQGSRILRTLIGLGAGKTRLDTKTYIYNVNKSKKTPWLTIWTSGHSGHEPGALFSAMPSPMPVFNIIGATSTIATIINHSNKGLTQDAKRTGRILGNTISKELYKQY